MKHKIDVLSPPTFAHIKEIPLGGKIMSNKL